MQFHDSAGSGRGYLDNSLVQLELDDSLLFLDRVAGSDEDGDDVTAVGALAELGQKQFGGAAGARWLGGNSWLSGLRIGRRRRRGSTLLRSRLLLSGRSR